MPIIVDPLDCELRAARTLQAPQQVTFDPVAKAYVVKPDAFRKQSDGTISVDLEEPLILAGKSLDAMYGSIERSVGMVAHKVGRLTKAGFAVSHKPVYANDYHGEARGNPGGAERRALANECEIIRPIDQLEAAKRRKEEDERLALRALEDENSIAFK